MPTSTEPTVRNEMSSLGQQIAVAEAVGWTKDVSKQAGPDGQHPWTHPEFEGLVIYKPGDLPGTMDFARTIRMAAAHLSDKRAEAFLQLLGWKPDADSTIRLLQTSPAELSKAFLLAMGKWDASK